MGPACNYTLILYKKGEYKPSGVCARNITSSSTNIHHCTHNINCVPTHKLVTAERLFSFMLCVTLLPMCHSELGPGTE